MMKKKNNTLCLCHSHSISSPLRFQTVTLRLVFLYIYALRLLSSVLLVLAILLRTKARGGVQKPKLLPSWSCVNDNVKY